MLNGQFYIPNTFKYKPMSLSNGQIGAFICHCGGNISDINDIRSVEQKIGSGYRYDYAVYPKGEFSWNFAVTIIFIIIMFIMIFFG